MFVVVVHSFHDSAVRSLSDGDVLDQIATELAVRSCVSYIVDRTCDEQAQSATFAEAWNRHSALEAMKSQIYDDLLQSLVRMYCLPLLLLVCELFGIGSSGDPVRRDHGRDCGGEAGITDESASDHDVASATTGSCW
jgi:hypothetical protein